MSLVGGKQIGTMGVGVQRDDVQLLEAMAGLLVPGASSMMPVCSTDCSFKAVSKVCRRQK